jgi:DNA-binding CsgD family transcriptional regulator
VLELRERRGTQLDPSIVGAVAAHPDALFDLVDDPTSSVWDRLLDAEPEPWATVGPGQLDRAAVAFARFADLKSTWFAGHSEAVAALAVDAATVAGLDAGSIADVHLAGLLHDLGRVAIPTGTWDAPRAFRGPERDRVQLHAWETQRILAATPLLAHLAPIAGGVHERCDGSGYHRGLGGGSLDAATQLLTAADVACALREDRPHRPARSSAEAERVLADEVAAGRLARDAVAAVLEAGGATSTLKLAWPAALSDREVEVVRLVARGASNKEIAAQLGITAKTVAHHVAHAYDKTGCRSRAGMSLFAVEHGLVGPSR